MKHKSSFTKAVRFIYENIDQPIGLVDVANAAGLSLSSLKRVFLDATDASAGSFMRRLRMELAFRSLKNKEAPILEIALSAGFEDHSAFSRCFKEAFGYTPTSARQKINIVGEFDSITLEDPEVRKIDAIKIQAITKKGLYFEAAPNAWASLQEKLTQAEINDDFAGVFIGIGHDNPHDGDIAEDQVRFSAGITFLNVDLHIDEITIPGGVYAKFNYSGKPNNLGLAYHHIYGAWQNNAESKIDATKSAFILFSQFPSKTTHQDMAIYVPIWDRC